MLVVDVGLVVGLHVTPGTKTPRVGPIVGEEDGFIVGGIDVSVVGGGVCVGDNR